ncbi:hypothetical protein V8F06_003241 [Rhypophila decipiens]
MAPSLSLRDRISSPLEAGTSIADGHYLPAHLTPALEYASKRLLRKGVSVTLLVVRRDYQLPTSPLISPCSPAFPPPPASPAPVSAASTPLKSSFGLKQFVRSYSSTGEAPIRERILFSPFDQFRNGCASPAVSEASVASGSTASTASTAESTFSRRLRWPTSPTNGSVPMTPATPFSVVSSSAMTTSTDTSSAVSGAILHNHPGQFGIKLVHVGSAGARDERILAQTLDKTAKKFRLGAEWLPQAVSPTALDLPADVAHRSLVQHETLFASENLTLLSLDHLYTFRTALQSYARTQASPRLEDAVDELRRLFLANGRKKLLKSALLAAYRWLDPVSDSALSDVCRMYSRAYGGLDLESGVENDVDSRPIQKNTVANTGTPSPQYSENDAQIACQKEAPIIRRNDTPVSERPWQISPEEKEFLYDARFDDFDDDDDDDLLDNLPEELAAELKELDEIEAWYRNVQINVDTSIELSIPPSPALYAPPPSMDVVCVLPPPPPPPPIMHIESDAETDVHDTDDDEDIIHSESEFEERRPTPKLAPRVVVVPPPLPSAGRPLIPMMNLRLQTSFTPKPKAKRRSPTKNGDLQRREHQDQHEEEEEEDEDLTARPKSAIVSTSSTSFPFPVPLSSHLSSIDTIMNGGGHGVAVSSRIQSLRAEDRHVAPITPNGYDDISPITRGEWGFFMNGGELGSGLRKAAVEMC